MKSQTPYIALDAGAGDRISRLLRLSNHVTALGLAIVDEQTRYVEINQHLANIDNIPRDAHIGRSICSVVPEIGPMLTQLVHRTLQTKRPIKDAKFTARVPFVDGSRRDWSARFFPINLSYGAIAVAFTMVEITEVIRIEAALASLELEMREPTDGDVLTSRETDILHLIGQGKTTKEIAGVLAISPLTVGDHRKHICLKLDLHSAVEMAGYARANHPSGPSTARQAELPSSALWCRRCPRALTCVAKCSPAQENSQSSLDSSPGPPDNG